MTAKCNAANICMSWSEVFIRLINLVNIKEDIPAYTETIQEHLFLAHLPQ